MTVLFISCGQNDDISSHFYEGVNYNKLNGLNAESTWLYDVRDNEVYAVVEIGGKFWMAENLRHDVSGAMLNPNNPSKEYGRLYDWTTAKDICPTGWHLSSDADWKGLEEALGMEASDLSTIGGRNLMKLNSIKAQEGWKNNNNGSNTTNFSIFPAGRYESGGFKNIEDYAFFWTSTINTANESIGRYIFHSSDQVNRVYIDNSIGHSCRCVLN